MITLTVNIATTPAILAKCFKAACKEFGYKTIDGFEVDEKFLKEFGEDIVSTAINMGITEFFVEGINADLYMDFVKRD